MIMMNYVLEIVVILLLSMTVLFCWSLHNKITEIRSTRKDMAGLVRVFDEAINNTNNSLTSLKEASANAAIDLKKYSVKSHELVSELAFMNDTAVRLADRLEGLILEGKDIETRCNYLIDKASKVKMPARRVTVKKAPTKAGTVTKISKIHSGTKSKKVAKVIAQDDTGDEIVKKKTSNKK